MYNKFLEKIKEFQTIIIHRHARPDGDCIGSQVGLKHLLKNSFPDKNIFAVGSDDLPSYLLPFADSDEVTDEQYSDALVIVVDTSNKSRIYDERWQTGKYIIKIDHHNDSEQFGDLEIVENEMPANCVIISKIASELKSDLVINQKAANSLYLGILTDTSRFKYRGVNGDVLRLAGMLLDNGAEFEKIQNLLYLGTVEPLKLQGYVLENFKTTENGVLSIYFSQETMDKYNVDKDTAAGIVNLLDSIKGSMIWVCFIEQDNGDIRGRVRSRHVHINDIAAEYRGGGHLNAAGITLKESFEVSEVLSKLDEKLKIFKLENPELL